MKQQSNKAALTEKQTAELVQNNTVKNEAFINSDKEKQEEILRLIQITQKLSVEEKQQLKDYLSRCEIIKST